jgi:hypothetical protein
MPLGKGDNVVCFRTALVTGALRKSLDTDVKPGPVSDVTGSMVENRVRNMLKMSIRFQNRGKFGFSNPCQLPAAHSWSILAQFVSDHILLRRVFSNFQG